MESLFNTVSKFVEEQVILHGKDFVAYLNPPQNILDQAAQLQSAEVKERAAANIAFWQRVYERNKDSYDPDNLHDAKILESWKLLHKLVS